MFWRESNQTMGRSMVAIPTRSRGAFSMALNMGSPPSAMLSREAPKNCCASMRQTPKSGAPWRRARSIILGTLSHNEWTDAKDLEKELISHVSKANLHPRANRLEG